MTTLEMEIVLMTRLDIRRNLIVPNASWGMGLHECDLILLTSSGYATEIEIKISKQDLKKDKDKNHNHDQWKANKLIKYLYFAVPKSLEEYALQEIPERAGLYIVHSGRVIQVRKPQKNKNCRAWTDKERYQLARLGALRILGLKKNLKRCKNKRK